MKRSLPLVVSALALLLAGCTPSGAISGKVIVGPGKPGLAAITILLQEVAIEPPPTDPNAPKTEVVPVGQFPVGVSEEGRIELSYMFTTLDAGKYFVGAFLDEFDDRQITTDELTIDLLNPIIVDPADPAKVNPTRDIYLLASAPGMGTVKGTLHTGGKLATEPLLVFLLSGSLIDPTAQTLAVRQLPAGADVPFTFFNVPPTQGESQGVHVLALAEDGCETFFLDDHLGFSVKNPIRVSGEGTGVVTGADIWLGRQAPERSSISGKITLSAKIAEGEVALLAFTNDPTLNRTNPVGHAYVPLRNVLEAPFTLPSMPVGKVYLAAFLYTRDPGATCADEDRLSAVRTYSKGEQATEIELKAGAPGPTDIDFRLGVGRVSGKITLGKQKEGLKEVWVIASKPSVLGGQNFVQWDSFPVTKVGTNMVADYEMFGLEDDTFLMSLIPDNSGNGDWQDEYQITPQVAVAGTPTTVTIEGGNRSVCDFVQP